MAETTEGTAPRTLPGSDDILSLSLTDLARGIAAGDLSSRQATEAVLAALDGPGRALDAVVAIDHDGALRAADSADDARAKGRISGPLHGVPLAHKDMFYRAGRVSGCGSRIRADFVAERTATVLQKLDMAGALDVARLHMSEFAYGITGHNEVTATARNPWNPAHITGGSSSGSAATVAARLNFAALGSDTGGSIRVPAACCGLVGLKPTYGRVSRAGAMPLSFSLDHVGGLVRTVGDAALFLRTIAGADPADTTAARRPVPDYLTAIGGSLKGRRIGIVEGPFPTEAAAEVAQAVAGTHAPLKDAGAELKPVRLDGLAEGNAVCNVILQAETSAYHRRWLAERPQDYGRQTRDRLLSGLMQPAATYIEALRLRAVVQQRIVDAMGNLDALLLPMLPGPVPTIAESDIGDNPGFMEQIITFGNFSRPFNAAGLPALSVPCGFDGNGVPFAFQLVARPFDEEALLAIAWAYERETGITGKRPPAPA